MKITDTIHHRWYMNTVRNYSTFHIIAWHIKMGSVLKKKETDIVFKTIKPFNLQKNN